VWSGLTRELRELRYGPPLMLDRAVLVALPIGKQCALMRYPPSPTSARLQRLCSL
jgi:hypothetical protein